MFQLATVKDLLPKGNVPRIDSYRKVLEVPCGVLSDFWCTSSGANCTFLGGVFTSHRSGLNQVYPDFTNCLCLRLLEVGPQANLSTGLCFCRTWLAFASFWSMGQWVGRSLGLP